MVPQIPEAIGRAILRTEAALNAVLGGASPDDAVTVVEASICADGGSAGADGHAPADDPADRGELDALIGDLNDHEDVLTLHSNLQH